MNERVTDTPRADALEETLALSQLSYANRAGDAIAFARQLERELAEARAKLREAADALDAAVACHSKLCICVGCEFDTDALRIGGGEMSERSWENDLMVTDDDAGCLHWRKAECCDRSECVRFFSHHDPTWLYPPWDALYAADKCPNTGVPREFCTCHLCKGAK